MPYPTRKNPMGFELLFTRMLFSALVDADFFGYRGIYESSPARRV